VEKNMPEENPLDKLRVAKETEYFLKQEEALLRELKRRAALEEQREQIAAVTKIGDEDVLQDLLELGFDRDTANLLHIVPLVEIAWAEGKVTERERDLILELARARGVATDTPAYRKLSEWLSVRPGEAFFARTLDAIARVLAALPADQRDATTGDLVSQCKRVAEASGGFLGVGSKISPEEAEVLEKVVSELQSGSSRRAHGKA
jgi:hypothetical protein